MVIFDFLVNEGPGVERIKRMIQFAQEHSDHVTLIGYEGFEKEIEIKGRFIYASRRNG